MADLSAEEMRERIRALEEQVYPDSMARPNTMPLGSAQEPADPIHTEYVRLKEQADDPEGETGLRGLFVDGNGILKKVEQDGSVGTISGAPSSAEFVLLSSDADIPNGKLLADEVANVIAASSNIGVTDTESGVDVAVVDGQGSGLDADKLQGSEPQNIGVDTFDVGGVADGEVLTNSSGSLGSTPLPEVGVSYDVKTASSDVSVPAGGGVVFADSPLSATLPSSPSPGDTALVRRREAGGEVSVLGPIAQSVGGGVDITSDNHLVELLYDGSKWEMLSGIDGSKLANATVGVIDNFDARRYGAVGNSLGDYYQYGTGDFTRDNATTVGFGSQGLRATTYSANVWLVSTSGLPHYIQAGDTFRAWHYADRTGSWSTSFQFAFLQGHASGTNPRDEAGYNATTDWGNGKIRIKKDGSTIVSDPIVGDNHIDEWTFTDFEWGTDGTLELRFNKADGTLINSISTTDSTYTSSSAFGITHSVDNADDAYLGHMRVL